MMLVMDISSILVLYIKLQAFRTPILCQSSSINVMSTVLGLLDGAAIYRRLAESVLTSGSKGPRIFQHLESTPKLLSSGDMRQGPY